MADASGQPLPPILAGPVRRVFHTLVALGGWVLFGYWWWLVARRVSAQEVRFTLLLIGIALDVIVLVTAAWALHNILIFRRRGPRTHLRAVSQDYSHDTLGRSVQLPMVPGDCLTAGIVKVRLQDGGKVYVAASYGAGPGSPAAGGGSR